MAVIILSSSSSIQLRSAHFTSERAVMNRRVVSWTAQAKILMFRAPSKCCIHSKGDVSRKARMDSHNSHLPLSVWHFVSNWQVVLDPVAQRTPGNAVFNDWSDTSKVGAREEWTCSNRSFVTRWCGLMQNGQGQVLSNLSVLNVRCVSLPSCPKLTFSSVSLCITQLKEFSVEKCWTLLPSSSHSDKI